MRVENSAPVIGQARRSCKTPGFPNRGMRSNCWNGWKWFGNCDSWQKDISWATVHLRLQSFRSLRSTESPERHAGWRQADSQTRDSDLVSRLTIGADRGLGAFRCSNTASAKPNPPSFKRGNRFVQKFNCNFDESVYAIQRIAQE